jgi:hypothetical protein
VYERPRNLDTWKPDRPPQPRLNLTKPLFALGHHPHEGARPLVAREQSLGQLADFPLQCLDFGDERRSVLVERPHSLAKALSNPTQRLDHEFLRKGPTVPADQFGRFFSEGTFTT